MTVRIHSNRPSKYRNRRVCVDGLSLDSVKEARRWGELCLLARQNIIKDLVRQHPYAIVINGVKVCKFIADFVYQAWDEKEKVWRVIVEDCKGFRTPVFKIKAKLMKACHGIEIKIT